MFAPANLMTYIYIHVCKGEVFVLAAAPLLSFDHQNRKQNKNETQQKINKSHGSSATLRVSRYKQMSELIG